MQRHTGRPIGFEQFMHILKELDFKPPCRCSTCKLQYRYKCSESHAVFSYMGELEADEATMLARARYESIKQDWHLLRKTVLSHGAHVLKRWCRSRQSRQSFLDRAKTGIYRHRSPVLLLANQRIDKTIAEQRKH